MFVVRRILPHIVHMLLLLTKCKKTITSAVVQFCRHSNAPSLAPNRTPCQWLLSCYPQSRVDFQMDLVVVFPLEEAMEDACKATITLGDTKITFEGPASFVQSQVDRHAAGLPGHAPYREPTTSPTQLGASEKRLIAEKRPRGHHEISTVLAFALTESGLTEFSEEDTKRAYIRAETRPPKSVGQALRDARSKFDYISAGSKRGLYRITNHGDRTVRFDLPRA